MDAHLYPSRFPSVLLTHRPPHILVAGDKFPEKNESCVVKILRFKIALIDVHDPMRIAFFECTHCVSTLKFSFSVATYT